MTDPVTADQGQVRTSHVLTEQVDRFTRRNQLQSMAVPVPVNENGVLAHDRENMRQHEAVRDERFRTIINLQGHQYTRAWSSLQKIVYRCSRYRATQCRGKVEFLARTMEYANFVAHSCRNDVIAAPDITDIVTPMQQAVDSLALSDLAMSASVIWQQVDAQFYGDGAATGVLRGLSRQQVLRRVYRTRARHFGGNVHGRIEVPPLSRVRDAQQNFFQFHYINGFSSNSTPQRIIGWANPELIQLLKYTSTTLFVDGTFRCVPRGFKQCVVIMVHDRASGFYIPVFYVLATSKTQDTYWDIFHFITQATDQMLEPAQIICDFESALINAVQVQFPNADVIGCLFHFKQAVRRKLKNLHISEAAATLAMRRGILDMLTVIPPDRVATSGIAWVKQEIQQKCTSEQIAYNRSKWRRFWAYFRRTWIDRFPPAVWNVHGMSRRIVARTNNPLERFNRELNRSFPTPHPNLPTFIATIEAMARGHVATLAAVRGRRAAARPVETIVLPTAIDLPEIDDSASSSSVDTQPSEVSMPSGEDGDRGNESSDRSHASEGERDEPENSFDEPDLSFQYDDNIDFADI